MFANMLKRVKTALLQVGERGKLDERRYRDCGLCADAEGGAWSLSGCFLRAQVLWSHVVDLHWLWRFDWLGGGRYHWKMCRGTLPQRALVSARNA